MAAGDFRTVQVVDETGTPISSSNPLDVSGGSGGTSMTDDATFTAGTTTGTPMFARFDDTCPDSVDENDGGVVRMSANRNLYVTIRDAAGNERGLNVDACNRIATTIGGTVTVTGDCAGSLTVDNAGLTELAAAINACQVDVDIKATDVDLMLGTDFSNVLGTASLILGTQADNLANTSDGLQTTTFLYGFDGTTWDRLHATAGDLHIHDGGNTITVDGTVTVQDGCGSITIDGSVTADLGCNNDVTIDGSAVVRAEDTAHSTGHTGIMALAVRDTAPAAVSGTDGDYEPVHVNDDGGVWTTLTPSHQGGWTPWSSNDIDETEEEVSSTALTVSGFYFWQDTAAPLYAQIFNLAAACVTVGTTAPTHNFIIPANADSDGSGVVFVGGPFQFCALSIAVTTGVGTNSGAPGANDAGVMLGYKN